MKTNPVVSVVVPTFNRERILPRALDSIVAQTFPDWEIILVDDGSTDGTAALAARYSDRLGERFRYLQEAHRGPCYARNCGIDAAVGRFVAFLDSDDEFAPTKLERQLALFHRRPELGLVYSDYSCIDLQGVEFPSVFDSKCRSAREVRATRVGPGEFVCGSDALDVLLGQYFIATITGLVRREVLGTRIRFLDDPAYAEEWLFYAEVLRSSPAGFIDEPLSIHHFTAGSVSRTSSHENTVRLVRTLQEMRRRLKPLTARQDATLRGHLAAACGQLAYDAQRAGSRAASVTQMLRAFRYSRRSKWLIETAKAATSVLWHGPGPTTSCGSVICSKGLPDVERAGDREHVHA